MYNSTFELATLIKILNMTTKYENIINLNKFVYDNRAATYTIYKCNTIIGPTRSSSNQRPPRASFSTQLQLIQA